MFACLASVLLTVQRSQVEASRWFQQGAANISGWRTLRQPDRGWVLDIYLPYNN